MICYFKGLFVCATRRATINVPPDQCYERVLAQAFWVLHCLSQMFEYMCTTATLPLVTASLILGQADRLVGPRAPGITLQFHTLLHRCRQRKSLRVVALGQRLRHFAAHIATTVGEAHGERVRRWLQAKKAGWYTVLADPQCWR